MSGKLFQCNFLRAFKVFIIPLSPIFIRILTLSFFSILQNVKIQLVILQVIAPCCLFLSAKLEEQPRKLEHVIKVANLCLQNTDQLDPKSEVYMGLECI